MCIRDSLNAMDAWIISIILKGIKDGDYKRLEFFLDQLLGKLSNVVSVDSNTIESWASVVKGIREGKDQEKEVKEIVDGSQKVKHDPSRYYEEKPLSAAGPKRLDDYL